MEKNVYLNEENYKNTKKKIYLIAMLILVVGLCIGGYFIYNGVAKPKTSKVESLQKVLEEKKKELEDKGIIYDEFAKYNAGESYDLMIITNALEPSFDYCDFEEYENNSITKEYCSAKNSISDYSTASSIMIGVFISVATCLTSFTIFFFAKGRDMIAFQAQSVMPVAKEVIGDIAPTIGDASKEISKGITEGIKEGIKENKE